MRPGKAREARECQGMPGTALRGLTRPLGAL